MDIQKIKTVLYEYCTALLCTAIFYGCGDSSSHREVDTGTEEAQSDPVPSDPDSETETETSIPVYPELCAVQTEKVAGVETGRFPLGGGPGSAESLSLSVESDSGRGLFAYNYIDADLTSWEIRTATYQTSPGADDAGDTVVREVGELSSPAPGGAGSRMVSTAAGPDGFLLVWYDGRYNDACTPDTINSCRLDAVAVLTDVDGAPLDEPIILSDEALGRPVGAPATAALPDGYLAVWQTRLNSETLLAAVRLDEFGRPVKEAFLLEGISVDTISPPVIAVGKAVSVVVYTEKDQLGAAALVWPHGEETPEEESVRLNDATVSGYKPSAAATGNGFLTVWAGVFADGGTEVAARLLDADGAFDGEIRRLTWASSVNSISAAASDEGYAVAFTSAGLDGAPSCAVDSCNDQVFVTLIDPDGTVRSNPVQITADPNRSTAVRLAWDGLGWTAVWQTWGKERWRPFYGQVTCE